MDLDEIRELIRMMKENQISEIDWEVEGRHIRLKAETPPTSSPPPIVYAPPALPAPQGVLQPAPPPTPAAPASVTGASSAAGSASEGAPDRGVIIRSPIVGTFYRSPAPDKPPFVEPGDEIDHNSVLCIIEAMKVMNEIKAETTGVLREVLVENNQPVEYGQPLFIIDPTE